MANAPDHWLVPQTGEVRSAFAEALLSRRSHDPRQVWPWQRSRLVVASPVIRDGDVVAVVVTDSPTGQLRSRILRGWLFIGAGEIAAMLLAVGAALRLTGWVLKPVRVLDATTHDIATGRLKSRVAVAGGPPELRRLARSFNEMADNVEAVLEQQRAFVADASHQLRNPLAALLLRIELLALELPEDNEEIASVRTEGKRLAHVLDDLLDLALAEHAEADLRLTDIGALAEERVAAWAPAARTKGVRLTGDCPPTTAWADLIALSSALDAVIDNAVKFTPEGGTVEIAVAVDGDTYDGRRHRHRPRPHRRGTGARGRSFLAQRPAPEREGLGPGLVHHPRPPRGGRRLDRLRPPRAPGAPGHGQTAEASAEAAGAATGAVLP